jgi:hypothetical protein
MLEWIDLGKTRRGTGPSQFTRGFAVCPRLRSLPAASPDTRVPRTFEAALPFDAALLQRPCLKRPLFEPAPY